MEAAQERGLPLGIVTGFEEVFGKGVHGLVPVEASDQPVVGPGAEEKVDVAVGNRTFMQHLGISVPTFLLSERERRVEHGQICSFIAVMKQVEGLLVLEDVPRPELSRLSTDLRAAGIKETIL